MFVDLNVKLNYVSKLKQSKNSVCHHLYLNIF